MPDKIFEKNGLPRFGTSTRTAAAFCFLKFLAFLLTRYPVFLIASLTASNLVCDSSSGLLSARLTVAVETPAAFAIS